MLDRQNQSAGEGALAVQAGGNALVIQGISYESARQIALDVYQANFPVLVMEAAGLARARAEELTDKFLKQLHLQNPDALSQATTPSFQNALLKAQREHACAGDSELADLLVDLLVDRTKEQPRSLLQIVIDLALETAPKLTEPQLAVLGAVFLLGYAKSLSPTWEGVVKWLKDHLEPVLSEAVVTTSTLSHLQFTGCANVSQFQAAEIASGLLDTYSYFFQTGVTSEQLAEKALPPSALQFIQAMPGRPGLVQVNILSPATIGEIVKAGELDAESAEKLKQLLTTYRKSAPEFREQVVAELPFMQRAFDFWQVDQAGQIVPTSVGLAIGHAYVKKTIKNEFAPLNIWIK